MNWGLVNNIVLKGEGTFDADPMMLLDKVEKARKFRDGYCSKHNELCSTCPYSYKNNKHGIPCKDLTIKELTDIYNELNKEDKTMTKKEEIQQEIEKTQKQLAALQEKLKEAEDEVPEELKIGVGDEYYYVSYAGDIDYTDYTPLSLNDIECVRNRRAFLSKEYAKIFAEKTQFIADQLHFKYLYDRDYVPDWRTGEGKYIVVFDYVNGYFCENFEVSCGASAVQFSTRELAEHCAKWLNKKYGYTKE